MVLQKVFEGAGPVVEGRPSFQGQGFLPENRDLVDRRRGTGRVNGRERGREILYCRHSQDVVHPVDILRADRRPEKSCVERLGTGQIGAERLFDGDPGRRGQPERLQGRHTRRNQVSGQRKVDRDRTAIEQSADRLAHGGGIEHVHRPVVEPFDKRISAGRRQIRGVLGQLRPQM